MIRWVPAALLLLGVARCFGDNLELKLTTPAALNDRLHAGEIKAKERQAAVEQMFRQVGCEVKLQPVSKSAANVICHLQGETSTTIVVGSHYDFADKGEGIVDDWSGTALLPALYETLKRNQQRHSFVFVAFTGEERGLLGSRRYVKEIKAGGATVPEAFVNLECLGLGTPEVWGSRATPLLLQRLIEIAQAIKIPLEAVNVDQVGDDDSHPFLDKKIPVITIHSLTQESFPILHSKLDNASVIHEADYYSAYKLAAFYLKYLDGRLAAKSPEKGAAH